MNTHFLFIEVGYKHGSENLLVARLRIELLRPVDDGIGHLQAGHGKSHARHKIGDKLLKKISQRLISCTRESDTVGRIGGDEFIVLLPIIDNEFDATLVANKIIAAVSKPIEIVKPGIQSQPIRIIDDNLQVSASIGISIYPEHGIDEKLLVINADLAMYQAKKNGKNQAQLFDIRFSEQKPESSHG